MAKRKSAKRKSSRKDDLTFLIVRGAGNEVFVAAALPALKDRKLAAMLDAYRGRPFDGIDKSPTAFLVTGEAALATLLGGNLGPPKR